MSKSNKKTRAPRKGRVLAFDQASIKTGYSVFDGTDLAGYGLLVTEAPKDDSEARLNEMSHKISDVVNHYNPEFIVFEGVVYQQSPGTLIILANVQGVIRGICFQRGIDYNVYAPTAWRRLLKFQQGTGIKREQLKKQAIALVRESYGIDVEEDVCEAICIGLAHLIKTGLLPDIQDFKEN